jgi:hypothetical protein
MSRQRLASSVYFVLETTDPIAAWRLFNDIKKQVKTSTAAATAIARGDVEQGVQFLKTGDGDMSKKRRKDWLEGGMNRSKKQCNHAPLISTKKKVVPRDNGKNPTRQPAIALEKHEAERSKVASEKEKKVETLKLKMAAMWREAKDVEEDSDLKTVRLFDFDLAGKLQHADIGNTTPEGLGAGRYLERHHGSTLGEGARLQDFLPPRGDAELAVDAERKRHDAIQHGKDVDDRTAREMMTMYSPASPEHTACALFLRRLECHRGKRLCDLLPDDFEMPLFALRKAEVGQGGVMQLTSKPAVNASGAFAAPPRLPRTKKTSRPDLASRSPRMGA